MDSIPWVRCASGNVFYEFCLSSPEAHFVIVFSFKDTICDGHLDLVFEGLILARSFLIAIQIQIVIPSFTTDAMFLIVFYLHYILQLTTARDLHAGILSKDHFIFCHSFKNFLFVI